MKKTGCIIAITAALMALNGSAQESQKFTANKMNEYGLVYSLPQTHLNIEIEAVKTVKKAGPYYKYAKKYLGVNNVISKDSQTWDIKSVEITPFGVPNKSEEYLMEFKGGNQTFLILDSTGLPLAINKEVSENVIKRKRNKLTDPTPLDGNIASVFTEEMIASESTMKKAEAAAAKILELRETRNDLVSGNADQMPPDGASLKLMLDELSRQEEILTAMFVGTTQVETKVVRLDYVPANETQNEVLFRISNYNGIVDKNDLSGDPAYLNLKITSRGELPTNEKGEVKEAPKGAVMYCIPGKAEIEISYDGKKLARETVDIAQFGVKYGLNPKTFTNKKTPAFVVFNPETGGIKETGILEVTQE